MINLKVFYATEARGKLFELLRLVEKGQEIMIIKKDSNSKFKLSLIKKEGNSSKASLAQNLAGLDFKSRSPQEISRIIESGFRL
ncbi:hypothetical protein HYW46_01335 [Candidatus Daviesbacteria bacterium]|nr:hypothetical protein [Candidatus Daviesbacteria bacterium]